MDESQLSNLKDIQERVDPFSKSSIGLLCRTIPPLGSLKEGKKQKFNFSGHQKVARLLRQIFYSPSMPEPWIGRTGNINEDEARLYSSLQISSIRQGSVLFKIGQHADYVYIVLQGEVKLMSQEFSVEPGTSTDDPEPVSAMQESDDPMILNGVGVGGIVGDIGAVYKGMR